MRRSQVGDAPLWHDGQPFLSQQKPQLIGGNMVDSLIILEML